MDFVFSAFGEPPRGGVADGRASGRRAGFAADDWALGAEGALDVDVEPAALADADLTEDDLADDLLGEEPPAVLDLAADETFAGAPPEDRPAGFFAAGVFSAGENLIAAAFTRAARALGLAAAALPVCTEVTLRVRFAGVAETASFGLAPLASGLIRDLDSGLAGRGAGLVPAWVRTVAAGPAFLASGFPAEAPPVFPLRGVAALAFGGIGTYS